MKVFLSWSGARSRSVAEALRSWLPRVIQAVEPFVSGEIEKGARWSNEVDEALEGTRLGIICLTKDNLDAPWVLFEAGALSKTSDAYVWTFLVGLAPSDIEPPLSRFQHTVAEKEDVRRLMHTINRQVSQAGERALGEQVLDEIFETFWPQLEAALQQTTSEEQPGTAELRSDRELLEEILELTRAQATAVRDEGPMPGLYRDFRLKDPQGVGLPFQSRLELEKHLPSLPERDAKVLMLLYGSADRLPIHIDGVADILGISRERVRQIHNRALHRIGDRIAEKMGVPQPPNTGLQGTPGSP